MKTKYLSYKILLEEGIKGLIEKLGPVKASKFWLLFLSSNQDYLKIRKRIFNKQSIDNIYKDIKKFLKTKK